MVVGGGVGPFPVRRARSGIPNAARRKCYPASKYTPDVGAAGPLAAYGHAFGYRIGAIRHIYQAYLRVAGDNGCDSPPDCAYTKTWAMGRSRPAACRPRCAPHIKRCRDTRDIESRIHRFRYHAECVVLSTVRVLRSGCCCVFKSAASLYTPITRRAYARAPLFQVPRRIVFYSTTLGVFGGDWPIGLFPDFPFKYIYNGKKCA